MAIVIMTAGTVFLLCFLSRLYILNFKEQTALNLISGTTVALILGVLTLLMFSEVGKVNVPTWIGLTGIAYGFFAYWLLSRVFRKEPSIFELAGLKKQKTESE